MVAALFALALLPAPARLAVISWDGAADWVVDRLLREGKLPNVEALQTSGFAAGSSMPPFPSKTAVSHFAIFSGKWPRESGVTGNSVPLLPRKDHTLLETRSGFDANSHFVEPMWVKAAKQGKRVLALSAAGSFPPEPDQARLREDKVPLDRYQEYSGFESSIAPAQVFDLAKLPKEGSPPFNPSGPDHRWTKLALGESVVEARPIDDPEDPVQGYDTVEVRSGQLTRRLKPGPSREPLEVPNVLPGWAGPFPVQGGSLEGNAWFRLFALDPRTGQTTLYSRAINGMRGTESAAANRAYMDAYGGFHDDPFGPYQAGALGKPLYEGGDGEAERRVVEAIALDMEFLQRSFVWGLRQKPDLVFQYSPQTDSAGHCWMGLLDPNCPGYDPDLAGKIWPYYEAVYRLQDRWLGQMMAASPNTLFALVSDHGMEGVARYAAVNVALEKAGLLSVKDGKIDLTRTKVCAPPWSDFALVVNSTEWKGGIVPMSEKHRVLRDARKALETISDPDTGRRVVTRFWTPRQVADVGAGGPAGGDLYLDFAPGYYPSTRLGGDLTPRFGDPRRGGVHGYHPKRRSMRAIFYAGGVPLPRYRVGDVRVVDIQGVLWKLMGW